MLRMPRQSWREENEYKLFKFLTFTHKNSSLSHFSFLSLT